MTNPLPKCIVCGAQLKAVYRDWVLQCSECAMLSSTLRPNLLGDKSFSEDERLTALTSLRQSNFEKMLRDLRNRNLLRSGKVLEIGPGQGFFLDSIRERGWSVTAVEPDHEMAALLRSKGWHVVQDVYPSATLVNERYDLIAFNDVLEHIPDVRLTLSTAMVQLTEDGALLVNLPSANGLFYRLAAVLTRLGWRGPYKRMWQFGFVSPHVHYFTPFHLRKLTEDLGFVEVASGRLPVMNRRGLAERIRYTRDTNPLLAWVIFAASWILIPLSALFPSDITYHLFRKRHVHHPSNLNRELPIEPVEGSA